MLTPTQSHLLISMNCEKYPAGGGAPSSRPGHPEGRELVPEERLRAGHLVSRAHLPGSLLHCSGRWEDEQTLACHPLDICALTPHLLPSGLACLLACLMLFI